MIEANADDARAILIAAGARDEDVRVEQTRGGWLVAWRGVGAGATDASDATMDTPQEVAEALVRARVDAPDSKTPEIGLSTPKNVMETTPEGYDSDVDDYGEGAEPFLIATEGDADGDPIEEPAPTFMFGDHLPTDRLVRQGQIAEHAQALIEEARDLVGWSDAEYGDLHSYVVSNLDKATGAFVGGDGGRYGRFVTMSEVEARVRRIVAVRDAMLAFIRDAGREAVATFEIEADWP